jgi:uncharacterized RDD family membrane protein YckC
MEIYLHKDGKRQGPYLIFKIRELLEDGKIGLEDLAWHEGLEKWCPLGEIEVVQGIQRKPASVEDFVIPADEAPAENESPTTPPPLSRAQANSPAAVVRNLEVSGRTGYAWRRFFARTLDNLLALTVFIGVGMVAGFYTPGELGRPGFVATLGSLFLWVFVEALLLHKFTRTPGKALLGLRVVDGEGNALSLRAAFRRSFDVWLFGLGTGLPFVTIFCQMMAFQRYRIMGITSWDEKGEFRPQQKPPSPFGIITYVLLVLCGMISIAWSALKYAPELADMRKLLRQGGQLPPEAPAAKSPEA